MSATEILGALVLLAWGGIVFGRSNFWRIEPKLTPPEPDEWPEIVALVPARNEETVIAESLRSLLAQDYPGKFSVVVVDDGSTDRTREIAQQIASDRIHIVTGQPLPEGWVGKMWALSQAVAGAELRYPNAELFLLTDADIQHAPDELRRMVALLIDKQLDLASLMVRLNVASLAERAIVPAFVYFFRLLYPFRLVADIRNKMAAAAGGYILIRRRALARIGGLTAIKDALIDDCALARKIKESGGPIRLDLTLHTTSIRPYGWGDLSRMIARSAYDQLDHSPLLLLGTVVGMLVGFVVPPILTLANIPGSMAALFAWALMALSYAPMVRFYRLSPAWALLLPVVAMFYLGATLDSAWRHWLGKGGQWKGRIRAGLRETSP